MKYIFKSVGTYDGAETYSKKDGSSVVLQRIIDSSGSVYKGVISKVPEGLSKGSKIKFDISYIRKWDDKAKRFESYLFIDNIAKVG